MRVAGAGAALTNFAARRLHVGGLSCTAITRTLATTPVTSPLHETLTNKAQFPLPQPYSEIRMTALCCLVRLISQPV